jgi:hypothetical protein
VIPRLVIATACLWLSGALAQGQDGTPAERSLQVLAALLPGIYDNANQEYFDLRLGLPTADRHGRLHVRIQPINHPDLGTPSFWVRAWRDPAAAPAERRLWSLAPDAENPQRVRMIQFAFDGPAHAELDEGPEPPASLPGGAALARARMAGCDVLWRRDAGQYTGASPCGGMTLAPQGLWLGDGEPQALERARVFGCYVDIPGVAGGRDEPFQRHWIESLHDQGDTHWFASRAGQELGVNLRKVRWPMNNERGAFTRNSLVLYVLERDVTGVRTHGYGWTEPRAERIGLNLQWLLVNCYLESNRDVMAYFE